MAALNPQVMENPGDINVDANSSNMEEHLVQNNVGDDGSMMHFTANRSMPACGPKATITSTSHLTIFFNGSLCVYDGIPAEKLREIMAIAAAAAKSSKLKIGSQSALTSPFPKGPPPQGTTNNLASPQSLCFPAGKSSICRLQEFPIERRKSLQRFLEKRRDRLGSKSPYPTSATYAKVADNIDINNFCADSALWFP